MSGRGIGVSIAVVLAMSIAWTHVARGAETDGTVVLVAKPELQDPVYGASILIATSLPDGRHVGFILNKPTRYSLAEMFPEHAPSTRIRDPLYLGGPAEPKSVFALVQTRVSPGEGSVQLGQDLFLAVQAKTVDRLIEKAPERTRFFVGAVVWRPGELDDELKRGAWYVLDPETEFVLPSRTEGLWEELVHRAHVSANAI